MPYCDILRKPYFNVPPKDPRVDLLLKQASRPVRVRAFSYTAKDGRAFVSPYVYFGTILIYGHDAEKDDEARARNAVLAACGGDEGAAARIDFAWLNDGAFVLRAGVPGSRPVPFSAFGDEALAILGEYVAGFMQRSYADVLMARDIVDAEEDILFEGEDQFYEGFIGRDLLPLEANAGAGGALICDELAIAPEGSLAYEVILGDVESGRGDDVSSSLD